jgi:predicted amidohydrolase YtcJ
VHALWLSERALGEVEAAGLPQPGVDIPGGLVLRDAAGRPTGVLIDKAMDYARQ